MRYVVTAMIAALVLSYGAAANAQGRGVFIYDPGNQSCGKYLAAVRGHAPGTASAIDRHSRRYSDDHYLYMAWLGGFLSATNWWVMDAEHNEIRADGSAVDVWIRKWCEQNPTRRLIEAASAFAWDQRQEYLLSYFARQSTR